MKVALSGSHGVGKTSILIKLKEKLPNYIIQESPTRQAVQSSSQLNFGTTIETQQLVMNKYLEVISKAPGNYISPRCLVDVVAYTTYFRWKSDSNITEDFLNSQFDILYDHVKDFDMVFYVPIEFNLEEKGEFREGQEDKKYQEDIDTIIKFYLYWFGIRYIKLTGSVDYRVKQILRELNGKDTSKV